MRRALLCSLVTLAACGGETTPEPTETAHTIRVAWQADHRADAQAGVAAFTEVVTSLSGRRINVEEVVVGAPDCVDGASCVDALLGGKVDVYQATVGDLVPVFPELQVLDIPYLFEHDGVIANVLVGPFYTHLKTEMSDQSDLQLMALSHGGGWRGIATRTVPVRGPDDVRGLAIAVDQTPIQLELVRALGAEPRALSGSGASDDDVDGAIVGVLDLDAGRPLPFGHLTLDRTSYGVTLWLMNGGSYAALPTDLQQAVRVGFEELRRLSFGFPNEAQAAALEAFEAGGGQLHMPTADERRAFVMAGGRVSTWFMDTYGSDWLVWLEEAITEAERQVGRSP